MLRRVYSWLHRSQSDAVDNWRAFNTIPFDAGLGEY